MKLFDDKVKLTAQLNANGFSATLHQDIENNEKLFRNSVFMYHLNLTIIFDFSKTEVLLRTGISGEQKIMIYELDELYDFLNYFE